MACLVFSGRVYRVCLPGPMQSRANRPHDSASLERPPMHARLIAAATFAAACFSPLAGADEVATTQGTLIWRDDSCFFFVLKTPEGFGLYEFLGGASPMVGDVFEGKLTAFGGRQIMDKTEGKPPMAYSE